MSVQQETRTDHSTQDVELKTADSKESAAEKAVLQADHPIDTRSSDSEKLTTHGSEQHAPKPLTMDGAMKYFLNPNHLYEHVMDSNYIELPEFLGGKVSIPNPLGFTKENPIIAYQVAGKPLITGQFTKFMALEFVAAIILCFAFILAARKTKVGEGPRGRIANLLETFVIFIRDEIAKPAIGTKDAYRFLPYLLTLFFFILILNLMGMLPWLGSVTGSISVTIVLAACTFLIVIGSGIKKMGMIGFLKAQIPEMDLPPAMKIPMILIIWPIEIFGLCVKHFVLAIRLFANMFGGHLVLAAFLAFIGVASAAGLLGWGISFASIMASIAFNVLELLVAFLQAYIFTFLAALFIGSAQHAH